MSEKFKRGLIACLIMGFFVAVVPLMDQSPAQAKPFRMGVLPDKGAKFGCGTCHVNPAGGGPRNSFGQDYEKVGIKAGDKYTQELGAIDSDKDGATNDQEFSAGTHPGDPASKPAR
ncbi:MAG: hypothetical protein NTY44_12830 [Deltaproteobacteria bacterium]|jgi:hypothetical protein|nr:hypothetical protein [Deltaproteobacteria bacterium]